MRCFWKGRRMIRRGGMVDVRATIDDVMSLRVHIE